MVGKTLINVTEWGDATVANKSHIVTHDETNHGPTEGCHEICLFRKDNTVRLFLTKASQKPTAHPVNMDVKQMKTVMKVISMQMAQFFKIKKKRGHI